MTRPDLRRSREVFAPWQQRATGLRALLVAGALLLCGCAAPVLAVDRAMEFEDGRTRFVAFAERERGVVFRGVEDVAVEFVVEDRVVARATTDERGVAMVVAKTKPGIDAFEARASFAGRDFRAEGRVVQWRSDRLLVACDIDSTILETDLEQLFFADEDLGSKPIAGSIEALHAITESHDLVYFTARPRFTLEKTRRWLSRHGYPDAPVLTSLALTDAIAEKRYKRREIHRLRSVFPNLLIGIGNTKIDSDGYGANGMLSLMLNPDGDGRFGAHSILFHDWGQIASFFEVNGELLADPARVEAAIRGEEMLLIPALRYLGAENP